VFLFWDAKAFIKSVLFSATRETGNYSGAFSLDVLMKWDGLPGRAAMLILMLLVYVFAFKGQTKKYFSSFLVMGWPLWCHPQLANAALTLLRHSAVTPFARGGGSTRS